MTEFQIGQSFQSKEEAVLSVKYYSIRRGVEYKVMESDNLKYQGRCKEFGNGCTWLIRIVMRKRKSTWEVRRYNGPHTCMATSISSDHKQLDYHVICARIFPLVRADASVSIKVLQEATEATYGFRPSYRKVWLAKQKAVSQIYGDWEESYADMSRWILGVTCTMEGSVALLKTSPVRLGDQVDEDRVYFYRMFWTFPPCIEVFRHCKPLVSINGTHLYGKYGGTLLLAIAQDGNSNILPVAHNGIKAALESPDSSWRPPHAYRTFCIRHVAATFALTFKGQDARRWLVNAAYAKTEAEFDYWFDIMRTENPGMCDWTAEAQLGSGHRFSQALVKAIERNLKDSRCFTVTVFDRHHLDYTVAETTPTGKFSLGSYRVSLRDHTCDCGYFQALHYPCCHALACCAQSRLDWATYVDEVYTMSEVFKVYQMSFAPCIPEGIWPPYDGPTVIPDPGMRRAREGRPRSTRIRNNMDEADIGRPKRCGLCRQPGHTRRGCPQRGSTSGI
ncbi:uncharacterized protein LOC107611086 [Arachis ipaensis]|uniref:uncharacterized protein LOC107611086 n=1 Tax=Arachis ipaensis TaxID=130454 RepID=UPI0007AFA44C|nr:uncharacterized protein LOC107611086 [Arachis ipaensis]XP_025670230.1 uncharacterized protein LOC112770009 [Arachis hypogaea]